MVTKECLKRIIWILLSAVFLVGCYDDGNYITEEETIESESLFYYESEEVSLSMVLSLFDIINSDPGIPKENIVRMCENICNAVNFEFPRLRDVIRALVNLKNIRMRIILAKTGPIGEYTLREESAPDGYLVAGGPISSCFYETHGYGLFRTGFKKAPVDRRYPAGLLPDPGSLRTKRILNHGQTVFFRGDLDARNLLIGIEKADRQLTDSHPVRIVNRPPRSICQSRGIGRTLRGNAARKAEQ